MLLVRRVGPSRSLPCRNISLHRRPSSHTIRYASNIRVAYPEPHPTVAIVGSGPAGFYTAQKLLRELPGTKVDIYEQLPVPFGLVRYGVAPDHPEVKNVEDSFRDVAASPNFKFIGNVSLGEDIPLSLLAKHYDALIFAYGASKDRRLGLKGEDKPHIYSARAFVGWYNGLPEYRDLNPDLTAGEDAIIVGQGNVALDVARTLLTDVDVLKKTDITGYALEALSRSRIKNIRVIGRRGPLQAAFTIKEVRELLHLTDVNFRPIPAHLFPPDIKSLPRAKRRLMELLQKGSPEESNAKKTWSLEFLLSPVDLNFSDADPSRLQSVTFVTNRLDDPASPGSTITSTDERVTLPTSTLFRSIGYKAEPIPGIREIGAVFDDREGAIKHDGRGRVSQFVDHPVQTEPADNARLYCSGWVKRGPTGVIASTMADAFETAEALVEDWKTHFGTNAARLPRRGWEGVQEDVARQGLQIRPVHWDGWDTIDHAEKREGEAKGKPREKMGRVEDMLEALSRS